MKEIHTKSSLPLKHNDAGKGQDDLRLKSVNQHNAEQIKNVNEEYKNQKQQESKHLKVLKEDLREAHFSMGSNQLDFSTEAHALVKHEITTQDILNRQQTMSEKKNLMRKTNYINTLNSKPNPERTCYDMYINSNTLNHDYRAKTPKAGMGGSNVHLGQKNQPTLYESEFKQQFRAKPSISLNQNLDNHTDVRKTTLKFAYGQSKNYFINKRNTHVNTVDAGQMNHLKKATIEN